MEKIKFGIQLVILLLAFPVWFVFEMQKADRIEKRNQVDNIEVIDAKKITGNDKPKKVLGSVRLSAMAFSKFVIVND